MPRHQDMLWGNRLESSLAEKALGVLGNTKPTMSHQCALGAQWRPTASWAALVGTLPEGRVWRSLPSAQHWRSQPWRAGSCAGLTQHKRDRGKLDGSPRFWSISYEKELRELALFNLEKKRPWGILSVCIKPWWRE